MKIYTKTGDRGETGLADGSRVRKDHPWVEAYGHVDELNALLGWVCSVTDHEETRKELEQIQRDLFTIGARLADPRPGAKAKEKAILKAGRVEELEKAIDRWEERLPKLKNFILPGGTQTAALLHYARTVCRHAERRVVSLDDREEMTPIVVYLNRLSDYLFVLARWENFQAKQAEAPW
ncbi:MAG: cob(I)yrinic acid a,c-diamide adenosyltransferase [Deltaproteobacteria bacterium]|nr:cob(I)yrinic acid a,c-diamide adenosyltransferase [Deltaproteobacteria bacterium]